MSRPMGERGAGDPIRDYWNDRAREQAGAPAATTQDVHLRELEIETFVAELRRTALDPSARVLDLGCGDGFSTVAIARALPHLRILGMDFSEEMIGVARARVSGDPDLAGRVEFRVGDARRLDEGVGGERFTLVMTDRCLINLPTAADQWEAIRSVADCLLPGGHYLAIENFIEGQEAMNEARARFDLPPIPVRWHNQYLSAEEFGRVAAERFESVRFEDFSSSYYLATRVLYSAMCRLHGVQPDYDHEIHRLAVRLPAAGAFSPIRLVVLGKARGG